MKIPVCAISDATEASTAVVFPRQISTGKYPYERKRPSGYWSRLNG